MSSDEKLLILKMLEEGKITSEEAIKLMDALDNKSNKQENSFKGYSYGSYKSRNYQDEIYKAKEKLNDWKKHFKTQYNQKDFDKVIDDFSQKADKFGKNFASHTNGFVDKIVDFVGSFVETNSFNTFSGCASIDKTFESLAFEGMKLSVHGLNGQIVLKKHLEDNIVIKSKIKSSQNSTENILNFTESGEGIVLFCQNPNNTNISVSYEILVPNKKFSNILLETSNARIYVEDSLSESIECFTKNSHIEIMGVNSDVIKLSTKNAKIQASYVTCNEIFVNTSNSLIDIKHIKSSNISAITTNGKVTIENPQNIDDCNLLNMSFTTTNASIKVNMNDMDNRGYKVNAQTLNGSINLLIPDISYSNIDKDTNTKKSISAISNNLDNYNQIVQIDAKTDNGYIEIIK